MNISIIGGSNSIVKQSYTHKLKNANFNIKNYAIGCTNSIYGIIQLIKYNLINNSDLIIYEYFVNDNNHFFQNINNVDRVNKTLTEITNMCAKSNTKLLFIYIYNKNDKINNYYDNSPMFSLYKNFSQKYNITTIDVYDVLYSKYQDGWVNYYENDGSHTHLSEKGMNILSNEITNILPSVNIPNFIDTNHDSHFFNLIQLSNYFNTINYFNSLINVNYLLISEQITIKFNKNTTIIALEYICDNQSGYIELSNSKNTIQKNTLKNEDFVINKNKKMASIITLNKLLLEEDDLLVIKNIKYTNIDRSIYDIEKLTFEENNNKDTNFKIISLLLSNNADVIDILI